MRGAPQSTVPLAAVPKRNRPADFFDLPCRLSPKRSLESDSPHLKQRGEVRVLVIGGAGYIGSHAARALRQRGHEVLLYDNLCTGHAVLARGVRAGTGRCLRFARSWRLCCSALKRSCISPPTPMWANRWSILASISRTMCRADSRLLHAVLDSPVRKFIYSSSCAVYGMPATLPITEDTAARPVNPYGVSKLTTRAGSRGLRSGLRPAIRSLSLLQCRRRR